MTFIYSRTVRFQDTDAAGVVYFANTLAMCHEAYEESLIVSGVEVSKFFGSGAIALPIVHAEADYRHPAFCGDRHEILLTPVSTSQDGFEIRYEIYGEGDRDQLIGRALTRHVCINPVSRERQPLPQQVLEWLVKWR
jgi:1,4-dihydroxy-2-naphthoyl-CoA hydrolase